MKINHLELWLVRSPLQDRKPGFFSQPARFYPAWIPGYPMTQLSYYLLKLRTEDGLEGHAAMVSMGEERNGFGSLLAPYVMGVNPMNLGLVNQRIQEVSYIGLRNGWIDAAFWDLAGKSTGKPVWQLLGGEGGKVTAYASTGTAHNPQETVRVVAAIRDAGFKAVKLRVHSLDMDSMVAQVREARRELGEDFVIMVDANQGWPVSIIDPHPRWDLAFATRFMKSIEEFNITWMEEPLHRGDVAGYRSLRENTSIPVAGGEINGSLQDFIRLLEQDALDIYQPDATLAGGAYGGGLSECFWVQQMVRAKKVCGLGRKIKYCPHTWSTGFGFGVNLQLVGALPPGERSFLEFPHEPPFSGNNFFRMLKNPFSIDGEGRVALPESPGLGMDVDWKSIRQFGKCVYKGTELSVKVSALMDRKWAVAMELKEKIENRTVDKSEFALPSPPFELPWVS